MPKAAPNKNDLSSENKWSGTLSGIGEKGVRSRRRGNATLTASSVDNQSLVNVDNLFDRFTKPSQKEIVMEPPSQKSTPLSREENQPPDTTAPEPKLAPTSALSVQSNISIDSNAYGVSNENLIQEQSFRMQEFERQQQEQFQRDMQSQRRILENKQREYKVGSQMPTLNNLM